MHPRVKLVMLCCVVLCLTAIPARLILDAEGDVDSVVGNGDDDDEDEDDDCGRHRSCGQRHHHGGCRHRGHCGPHHHDDGDDEGDDDDDDNGYTNSNTGIQPFYKRQCDECNYEIRNCACCEVLRDGVVCTSCVVGFLLAPGGRGCVPSPKSVVTKAAAPVV